MFSKSQLKIFRAKFLLPILTFVCGAALMIFELAAARILAPTIGSSTYVWTSVIGIIITALAFGAWLSGKVADQRHQITDIVLMLGLASLLIVFMRLIYHPFLNWLGQLQIDPRWQGVTASLILFAPTSLVFGFINPYLVKLNIHSLKSSGQAVAHLDAMNSFGGITGTFVAGFVLLGMFGSRDVFSILVILLILTSWLIQPNWQTKKRLLASCALVILAFSPQVNLAKIINIDTASANYSIFDLQTADQQTWRVITTGPGAIQSGIDHSQPDRLIFWYTQTIAEFIDQLPSMDKILVLGGGTFTLPQYLANKYPKSQVDVVEIDPELTNIAKQYFNLQPPTNLEIVNQDARVFVNQTNQKYDIVVVDIYSNSEIPFSILTQEYGQSIQRVTKSNGFVIANIISGFDTKCQPLWRAAVSPYLNHFKYGYFKAKDSDSINNIITIFANQPLTLFETQPIEPFAPVNYTDDFIPSEKLHFHCFG